MTSSYDAYGPSCDVVPGTGGRKPGWYLVAANLRVEAGAFSSQAEAEEAAVWLESQSRGVHPYPWKPVYTRHGLLVGTRLKRKPPGLTG